MAVGELVLLWLFFPNLTSSLRRQKCGSWVSRPSISWRKKGEREREGREGGRRERGRKKGEREEEGREREKEVQKEFTAWSVELHSYSQFLTFHGLHEVFWALVDFKFTSE